MNLARKLNIYPNPSNGLFNVELNSLSVNKVEISVLDVSGKVISKNTYQTSSSNLNVPMNISNVGVRPRHQRRSF